MKIVLTLSAIVVALFLITGCPEEDTEAPKVSMVKPDTTLTDTVTLKAYATDNKGVSKVEFYSDVDTVAIGEDTEAESDSLYSINWDTKAGVPASLDSVVTVKLWAKAYDEAGNVGVSDTVEATVDNTGK